MFKELPSGKKIDFVEVCLELRILGKKASGTWQWQDKQWLGNGQHSIRLVAVNAKGPDRKRFASRILYQRMFRRSSAHLALHELSRNQMAGI